MDRPYGQRGRGSYRNQYLDDSDDYEDPSREESPPPPETMSSWVSRTMSSTKAQFAATAIVSGAVVAGAILSYQALRQQERVEDLKHSIPDISPEHIPDKLTNFGAASPPRGSNKEDEQNTLLAERAQRGDYDNELVLEQLARNRVFLTDAGLQKLQNAFIIVVGCGGVGSHCVSALARSGASSLRLIDFDQVSLSSLNRHAVATLADVGTPKVHCLRKRLNAVTPWVVFDCKNELFSVGSAASLLSPSADGRKPDWVIDCIDNIDSKVGLLAYCHQNGIKVISSMGAGCKSDPTRIFIGDISTSTNDSLSRATRRRLRAPPFNIASGIPVVYSAEKSGPGKALLLPLPEDEFQNGSVGDLAPMKDFRVRILPVLGTMPAVFGYAVANHVILEIAGYPLNYTEAKGREKMYEGILAQVQGSEEKLGKVFDPDGEVQGLKIPLTPGDVGYIVEEVFRGKSAISGIPTRLALVRWRRPTENSIDFRTERQKISILRLLDLVCMTKEEAAVHEREVVRGTKSVEEMYNQDIVAYVEDRMREEQSYERLR